MVHGAKTVMTLAVAATVTVMLVLVLTGQGEAAPFIRGIYRDFPSRNYPFTKRDEIVHPLAGFLPRDVLELWYGHDEEGFTRNGRDVSRQMAELAALAALREKQTM